MQLNELKIENLEQTREYVENTNFSGLNLTVIVYFFEDIY